MKELRDYSLLAVWGNLWVIGTGMLIHQIFKPLYGDEEFETYIDRTEYE